MCIRDSTYTFPSGAVYDGPFVENQMHGEGTYTDEHGVQWKGTFYMGSGPGLPGHASAQASWSGLAGRGVVVGACVVRSGLR